MGRFLWEQPETQSALGGWTEAIDSQGIPPPSPCQPVPTQEGPSTGGSWQVGSQKSGREAGTLGETEVQGRGGACLEARVIGGMAGT